jgi:hypothetical protein
MALDQLRCGKTAEFPRELGLVLIIVQAPVIPVSRMKSSHRSRVRELHRDCFHAPLV